MKFKSKKGVFFSVVLLGLNAFLIIITIVGFIKGEIEKSEYWGLILIAMVSILLFWLYFGTNYELGKDGFIYRSGPFNGKISIDRITEIVKGKTLWMGFRPATARKGLIIKYDQYNEIYISPETNESFIKKILELKREIKITT